MRRLHDPGFSPWLILLAGLATVVGLLVVLRINAFLALIAGALVVSLLAPGEMAQKSLRVATAFGEAAGRIGVAIALAAIIGKCMMDSGAADRVVRAFLALLGEKRSSLSLMASGYVLSIPVFYDTVFYLLLPLARSMTRRTGRHYVKHLLAIAAGGTATHAMVPPTPGPLAAAASLGVDLGLMILIGVALAAPASLAGLFVASRIDRRMNLPLRPLPGGRAEPAPLPDERLPPLWLSLLPIVLPVALISAGTLAAMLPRTGVAVPPALVSWTGLLGDANFALLLAAVVALGVYHRQRRPSREEASGALEEALAGGGMIVLITAAGGAFGALLRAAGIGDAVESLFRSGDGQAGGFTLLALAVGMSVLFKVAQGSSTVAILTTSAMIAAMLPEGGGLGFHPVYLALGISSAALIGTWMNDSGFWLFARMGGLSERETLGSWTVVSATVGLTGVLLVFLSAWLLPLSPAA